MDYNHPNISEVVHVEFPVPRGSPTICTRQRYWLGFSGYHLRTRDLRSL